MFSYEDIFIESRVFSWYSINNFTFLVRKTVKQHLAEPYGQCNRYDNREQSSRTQCYRQCVQNQYNNRYNCVPIFIDYYNHDLDLKHIRNQFCEQLFNSTELPSMVSITSKCYILCHKECHQIRYTSSVKPTKSLVENKEWFSHFDEKIAIKCSVRFGSTDVSIHCRTGSDFHRLFGILWWTRGSVVRHQCSRRHCPTHAIQIIAILFIKSRCS